MASERDMSYPRHEPRPLPSYPPGEPRPVTAARAPLTARMRTVHWMAIDFAVAALVALGNLANTLLPLGQARIPLTASLLLTAGVFFSVALRRRNPVTAYAVVIIVGVILGSANPADSTVTFLAAAYVLYLVTAESNRRTGVAALALALIVMALIVFTNRTFGHGDGGMDGYVPLAFASVIAWMTGHSVRQRRLYAQTLQYQAASSAVAEERLRIARELHDVVAHSMSVIAVQAGYGQYVIDSSPADARDALGAIQATSRDALEEMRRMLGVLRQQDVTPGPDGSKPAPLAPAPGLADLDRLVGRTSGAGVQVRVEFSGRVRAVPAGVDLSAFRIIQEALTNVVKHAGSGARCMVSLCYGETALDIRVTDDGRLPLVLTPAGVRAAYGPSSGLAYGGPSSAASGAASGAGHGIIGMRERASLCGGEFSAGPLPGGGFQVAVTLPLLGDPVEADEADEVVEATGVDGAVGPVPEEAADRAAQEEAQGAAEVWEAVGTPGAGGDRA